MGWFCRTGITEFNDRSIANWPTQSTGADILRLSVVWATRHGLGFCAPVHDALLIESPIDQIEADRGVLRDHAAGLAQFVNHPQQHASDLRCPNRARSLRAGVLSGELPNRRVLRNFVAGRARLSVERPPQTA